MTDGPHRIDLQLELEPDAIDELERALLKARATELGEVRRRRVRLAAGYGDATTRETLDDEGRRAQLRHDGLSALLDAFRAATTRAAPTRAGTDTGGSDPDGSAGDGHDPAATPAATKHDSF